MSKIYEPDVWLVIQIHGENPHYKVLAGWFGSYLGGDSWRMNSGITGHEFDGDYWYFKGTSGSVYKCYVDDYGLRMSNAHVLDALGDKVSIVPDQAWIKKDWDWILK